MSFNRSWAYTLCTAVFYPFVTLVLTLLLFLHCISLYHHLNQKQQSRRPIHLRRTSSAKRLRSRFGDSSMHSVIITFGTPVFLALIIFSAAQNSLIRLMSLLGGPLTCRVTAISGGVAYWLSKCCLYGIFTARLHLSFKRSLYRYSIEMIMGLYCMNLVISLGGMVSVPWVLEGRRELAKNGPVQELPLCVIHFKHQRVGAVIVVLNDLIWTLLFVYLFCKPLRSLLYQQKQTEMHSGDIVRQNSIHDSNSRELSMLPIKYTLLTLTSTISTSMMIILGGVFSASIFVVTDYLINGMCVLLMTKHWKQTYHHLCGFIADRLASTRCCLMVWTGSSSSSSTLSTFEIKAPSSKGIPIDVHSPTSVSSDLEFPTVELNTP